MINTPEHLFTIITSIDKDINFVFEPIFQIDIYGKIYEAEPVFRTNVKKEIGALFGYGYDAGLGSFGEINAALVVSMATFKPADFSTWMKKFTSYIDTGIFK